MHAAGGAEAGGPGFLGGEDQDGGEPGGQAAVQPVQHGAHGAAAQAVGAVAIERVLADLEVEGAEIGGAEGVDVGIDAGPVVMGDGGAQPGVQVGQAVQHPAFQLRQGGVVDRISAGSQPSRLPSSQRKVLRRRR